MALADLLFPATAPFRDNSVFRSASGGYPSGTLSRECLGIAVVLRWRYRNFAINRTACYIRFLQVTRAVRCAGARARTLEQLVAR
jgi:hypothetical protein